jgi:hypothetical protein
MGFVPHRQRPQFDLRMPRIFPRRSRIRPEDPRCAAAGKCRTPASDRRAATLREETPALARGRPAAMGLALPRMDGLAFVAGHREARNSHCLAPQGFLPFLDVEDSER